VKSSSPPSPLLLFLPLLLLFQLPSSPPPSLLILLLLLLLLLLFFFFVSSYLSGKFTEVEGGVRRAAQTAPPRYGPTLDDNVEEMERLYVCSEP